MVHHSCYCSISFEADRLFFLGGSCAVCRARCTGFLGGLCSHSARSCAVRAALNPLLRRAARTSALFLRSTFSLMHSSWAGPGMVASVLAPTAGLLLLWLGLFRGCGTVVVMEVRLELQNDNQSTSYFPFLFSPKSISIYISTFHQWPMFFRRKKACWYPV